MKKVTFKRVMKLAEMDDYRGVCIACGKEVRGVEPDARRYECEKCGKDKVYGAEELVLMLA